MDKLKSYIKEGEHQQQDFKFRVDDSKKIARTLAAFANTDGGRLLVGVKDNGKIVGVNPEEEFHVIQGAASIYCKPEVKVDAQIVQVKHKMVLVVSVLKSEKKPIKAKDENEKWKTYVRRKDHTLLANKILVGVWKMEKRKTVKPQAFGNDEQLILNTIKEHNAITLSKLYRITKLNKNYIDKLLVLFISWGIIDMHITPTGTFYTIGKEKDTVKSE